MTLREIVASRREEILRIANRYAASRLRLFGSTARGEADEKSDIDLLVDMPDDHSLLDRAALKADLEKALGRSVDVATERSLKPRIRERILREAIPL